MSDLTVVGGVYIERCIQPLWNSLYGSAGRAVSAVTSLVPGTTTLVAYIAEEVRNEAEYLAGMAGAVLEPQPSRYAIAFDYLHPLSTPTISPAVNRIEALPPLHVGGDVVLRYGMLEGEAVVDARTAVYDPQSAYGAKRFTANGSRAERLAIVLNRYEAASMTGESDPRTAARWLLREEGAAAVVLKMGGHGALVVTPEGEAVVPLYRTEHVWKIGSGDVFSATFAALWGCRGMPPAEAADLASRATAYYCDTRTLPVPSPEALRELPYPPVTPGHGLVYLAAPFFDLGQRWLVEEARALLMDLGAQVFSPVHEVGPGPAEIVAPEDIKGLEAADVVFAVLNGLDSGTVFEAGYAVNKRIPVVALAQNVKHEDLKMLVGTGCEVVDDFATAIYRTVWKLPHL
ncbi:nucleoside 2-deoxyribosyltransferase [Microvirga flocculans]|uniref:Nucleoside 2-deoxyribosyltransferase n=1 Tax=Microvirga flocculans TaxID=217168 RepID=A0A7W6IFD7_9HYPH|nr:PfkB family carbohydrate kinase [Microvirga flocculans]MBB4039854.1 nucleoside 2-deoxyribosyltransferase [Microvirga flocculans]